MVSMKPGMNRRERRYFAVGAIGVLLASVVLAKAHVAAVDRQFQPGGAAPGLRINVNTADLSTLSLLDQIGPERARQIVAYRDENGPFQSYPELMRVSGIGRKTIEGLVEQVCFDD